MTLRLYLDEDSSDTDLLRALRLRGVDVVSAQELGTRGQSDDSQMERASQEGRVVYTCNRRDFYRIRRVDEARPAPRWNDFGTSRLFGRRATPPFASLDQQTLG